MTLPAGHAAPFRPRPLRCPPALSPLLALPAWHATVEDRPLVASLQEPAADADADATLCWLDWTLGGADAALGVPRWLLDAVLRSVEPTPHREPTGEVAAMLVELALEAPLARLEAALGRPVELRRLRDAPPPDAGRIRINCTGLYDGDPFEAVLLLPQDALPPLLSAGRSASATPCPEPRLIQAVRIGLAVLDLPTLRSLVVGDAVVLRQPEGRRAVLVCGEHLAATMQVADGRATLDGPLRPAATLALENWTMPDIDGAAAGENGPNDPPDPEDSSLDALQVTLVFELARRAVTLQEARALTAGTVLELGPVARQRVSVLAGGRRIGEGELVQVGEAMAVRLTRIHAG